MTIGVLAPDLSAATVSGTIARALMPEAMHNIASRGMTFGAAAPVAVTIPVDRTVTCAAGGSARTTGTIAGNVATGGSGALAVALSSTFTACGVTSGGRTLLLTSEPVLAITGTYAVVNRAPVDPQSLAIVGTIGVGISGSRIVAIPCDVELTITTSPRTHVATVNGTICGGAVSRQLLWTP